MNPACGACLGGAIDREPRAHACDDTRAPWVHLADNLPGKGDPDAGPAGGAAAQ